MVHSRIHRPKSGEASNKCVPAGNLYPPQGLPARRETKCSHLLLLLAEPLVPGVRMTRGCLMLAISGKSVFVLENATLSCRDRTEGDQRNQKTPATRGPDISGLAYQGCVSGLRTRAAEICCHRVLYGISYSSLTPHGGTLAEHINGFNDNSNFRLALTSTPSWLHTSGLGYSHPPPHGAI